MPLTLKGLRQEGCRALARQFYFILRREVMGGNPGLDREEQERLRRHYPIMANPRRYPPILAAEIYAGRRAHPIRAILESTDPVVFDAGSGFGSESFLFAALGARVLSVDRSAEQLAIARKRQGFFETLFGKKLDITFEVADLQEYRLSWDGISLTWLASVLAAVRDQGALLTNVADHTREGGLVMVTDMNLANPLFLLGEWRRRRRGKTRSRLFRDEADFLRMFRRKERIGARYFPAEQGDDFDDVQFFTSGTLSRLLRETGFTPRRTSFHGFVPPRLSRGPLARLERALGRLPLVRSLGYFYVVTGEKP